MLIYSAFIPYPPVKKDNLEQNEIFKLTLNSVNKVEQHLYATNPDLVILISSDNDNLIDFMSINFAEDLNISLAKLGDFNEYKTFRNDIKLNQEIKETSILENEYINVISENKLSYPESIASYLLLSKIKTKLLTIKTSLESTEKHYDFGTKLTDIIENSEQRIAIIAIGNLSHCNTKKSPFRYKKEGSKFDELIVDNLKSKKLNDIIKIEYNLIKRAKECGINSLATLLGVLKNKSHNIDILSYEHPLGVGYLVTEFILK